jgi:chorismate dehydratase
MEKYKVSLISYLNSRPFLYGLEKSSLTDEVEICLEFPSRTAVKIGSNQADIGLIPVGALVDLPDYQIVSDYCIGAGGPVRTVVLASEVPLKKIGTILLDYQSLSSVLLVQVLARFFWKKEVKWKNTRDNFENKSISGNTAGIVIGDRVFHVEKKYPYIYDLSSEWMNYTGFPFVFAVWVTRKTLSPLFLEKFNKAIAYGVENIPDVEKAVQANYPGIDIDEYFTKNISYVYDDRKKAGMNYFLQLVRELQSSGH